MRSGRKIVKQISYAILLLAAALCLNMDQREAFVAVVDTAQSCSLTLEIPKAYRSELSTEQITVRLYQIADITSDGAYQDIAGYEELHLSELSSDMTADWLEKKAQETVLFLGIDEWNAKSDVAAEREFKFVKGHGIQTDMEPGLYLVCVKPITTEKYKYQSLPYIISLPGLMEDINGNELYWKYDLVVDLKLARKTRSITQQGATEETISNHPPVHKTGDEMNLGLLIGCVIFFGGSFCILCYMEKCDRGDESKHE